jgi:predicted MFS family arabinose efflux permease
LTPTADETTEPPASGRILLPPRSFTWILGFCFAVEGALYSAVTPLMPLLARTLPLTELQAGILLGGYSGGLVAGSLLCVTVLKRHNARSVALTSLTALALSTALFGCATSAEVMTASRVAQGVAAGFVWTTCVSWLFSAWPVERRGEALGISAAPAIVGTIAGPLIGSVALTTGVMLPYLTIAVLCVCAAGGLLLMPRPARAAPGDETGVRTRTPKARVLALVSAGVGCLAGMVIGLLNLVSPLTLAKLGASDYVVSAVFLGVAGLSTITAKPIGKAVDRFTAQLVTVIALVVTSILLPFLGAGFSVLSVALLASILLLANNYCYIAAGTMLTHTGAIAGWSLGFSTALIAAVWGVGETLGAVIAGAGIGSVGALMTTSVAAALVALTAATVLLADRARFGRRSPHPAGCKTS